MNIETMCDKKHQINNIIQDIFDEYNRILEFIININVKMNYLLKIIF